MLQCKKIADYFGVIPLSSGDIFRAEAASGSDMGREMKEYNKEYRKEDRRSEKINYKEKLKVISIN